MMNNTDRIHLRQIVVLEGKYDKIKLESLVDAVIIKTDGFGIYKDREKQRMIRELASKYGAVIATDSDAAGFQIRGFLTSLLKGCEVFHLYIPDVSGKEKRKREPSAEGKIGVEGIPLPILREALAQSGVVGGETIREGVTKADFYELGLCGRQESSFKRKKLKQALGLPERMSANSLLDVINKIMDRKEFIQFFDKTDEME